MILDSLKNSALYYGVSPRMKQAFELIASTDWTTMEPGIHELARTSTSTSWSAS